MGEVGEYQHKEYASGRWKELSLAEQMGNSWGTDAKKMMRYYDGFAMLGRGL